MEYKTKGNGQMFMVFDEFLTEEEKKPLTDKDIQWENLRYWVEQQMSERRWAGDVYRYTAYEGVFKKMEELERS
jgi:hypothetical protein